MCSKLFKNLLLAIPLMAFSVSASAFYKVITVEGDQTAAEPSDTATFLISAEIAAEDTGRTVSLAITGDADHTDDFTLTFPASCEEDGAGTDTITFAASSTGDDSYDLTLGGYTGGGSGGSTVGGGTVFFTCVITIDPVDDMIDEDLEGFTLTLSGSSDFLKNPKSQVFTISDNDTAALVVTDTDWNGSDPVVLTQKATSESGDTDSFWVELATEPTANVTVDLAVSPDTEALISSGASGDVAALELTFTSGNWNTGQLVTITGQDDDPAVQDGNINFQVTVLTTTEADTKYNSQVGGPVNGVNADNDEPGQLRFTQSSQIGDEGDALVLQVERINGSSSEVTIDYLIENVGTTSGSDYTDTTPTATTLTWAEGDSDPKDITITLEDDALWEPAAEQFTVTLVEASITGGAALLTPSVQTITINPSDPITIAISAPVPDPVPEGDTGDPDVPVTFTVTYSGGTLETPMSISWATVDGTATAGSDYTAAGAGFDLPVNGDPVDLVVNVLGDNDPEGNETFSAQLSESFDLVTLAGGGASVATIEDDDAPDEGTFSITSISPNPVMESTGLVTVTVSRITDVNTLLAASVNIATSDGTALNVGAAAGDYEAIPAATTLDWAADDKADKTIDIVINDDEAGEPQEDFTVTITPVATEQIGTGSGVVNIVADPTVAVNPTVYTVSEDGGSVVVTVELANPNTAVTTVNYTTTDGSATAGDDYTTTSGTLSWTPPDSAPKGITIPILADADETGPESFTVDLSTCVNCTITAAQATVNVEEGEVQEPTPGNLAFSPTSILVGEGTGIAGIVVTRTSGTDGDVTIGWETVAGTATSPDDFVAASGTLSWADGVGGNQIIPVTITDDAVPEPSESFTVQFVADSETGTEGDPTVSATSVTVTIADDDSNDPGDFSVIPTNVNEGDGVINVSVTRDNGSNGAVSVTYVTVSGTATGANPADPLTDDYLYTTGTLDWADGDSSAKIIPVTIVDDAEVETEESFTVELSAPTGGASIANGTAAVTIFDNDGGGTFSISDVTVFEIDQQATVTVTRSNDNNTSASVFWQTFDGTAEDENGDNDYTSAFGEEVWLDGDTSDTRTITIPIIPDDKVEGDEFFTVTIVDVAGESVTISKADGVVVIKDPIPIPTLGQWAMGLMILLLLGFGMAAMPAQRRVFIRRS